MGTVDLNLDIAKHIVDICDELQSAGYETYIVGGAVRDFLLNKVPKDYDLSTSATPDEIRRVFGRRRARIIGRRFKLVHLHNGKEIIEVSTFRKIPSKQAQNVKIRHKLGDVPQNMIFNDNEFGTSVEDAQRRDFTINALFYDPVAQQLVDHTGLGLDDINNRMVRAIGNPEVRFEEDPVRLLRALKFAGQCDMKLEPETEKALKKTLPLIRLAAPSRLTLELEKILKNPCGHKILSLFRDYGFLQYFLPNMDKFWDSKEGNLAQKLLELRNTRVTDGAYRDSISVAITLSILPFVEEVYGKLTPGERWFTSNGRNTFADEIFYFIKDFYSPHALIKALIYSAQRTLLLLSDLLDEERRGRAQNKSGYLHAREVIIILNQIRKYDPNLEKELPIVHFSGRPRHKHKRRRHKTRKAKSKN